MKQNNRRSNVYINKWLLLSIILIVSSIILFFVMSPSPIDRIMNKYGCGSIALDKNSNGTVYCQKCIGCENPIIINNKNGVPEGLCDTPFDCRSFSITLTPSEFYDYKKEVQQTLK